VFRAPFTAFDTIRHLLGMGVLLGWRSVWPMDLQLYSLIVGLMGEARLCSATKASAKSSATPYTGGHFGVFYNRNHFYLYSFYIFL